MCPLVHVYQLIYGFDLLVFLLGGCISQPMSQTHVPAEKPLISNSLEVYEVWATVHACGGSAEGLVLPEM